MIPVVNRAGAQQVLAGRFALRKTPDTQVDLNRNWPGTFSTAAGEPEANPSAETYRGPAPLRWAAWCKALRDLLYEVLSVLDQLIGLVLALVRHA